MGAPTLLSRRLRRGLLVCALALAVTPTPAEAARSKVTIAGGEVTKLRLCGAVRSVVSTSSGAGLVARFARKTRKTRRLTIARCHKTRWVSPKRVRIKARRTRVKLPQLVSGGYRLSGRGLKRTYLRIVATSANATAEHPLLDRATVRAPMVAFCEGPKGDAPRPDSAPLPEDPRKLVNQYLEQKDAAVFYNAGWIPVRDAPGMRAAPFQYPRTCGEFRHHTTEGESFLFGRQLFQLLASERAYDNLWRVWGLDSKPADFDLQVRERYGLSEAPFKNPYAREDGSEGQLPLGLVRGQDKDTGAPNGEMTITCSACHDSILGRGDDVEGQDFYGGRGNSDFDAGVFGGDIASAAAMIGESPNPGAAEIAAVPYPYSAGRGQTNSFGLLDFLAAGFDMETLEKQPGVEFFPTHGAAGQVHTPNWWNRSHRPRMFLTGELSGDNTRVSMALAVPQNQRSGAEVKALEPKFEQVHVYFDSLSPPPFPKEVDELLAQEGAIIFHEKDLWEDSRNQSIPKVGGNGSCASCHGVYSPRYAHDEKFLPDPRLKGIEAQITPIETIQTDPARTRLVNEQFKRAWDTSWWGYDDLNPQWTPEGQGRAGTTFERLVNDYTTGEMRLKGPNRWSNVPTGYEAPPLYGAWASAPYFHNGSVPTIGDVLQPSKRPAIWRRPLTPEREGGISQGVDSSYAGYDFDRLGFKYTQVECDQNDVQIPTIPCSPKGSPLSVVEGELSKLLGPDIFVANQAPPATSEDDRQRRQIHNSNEYSMGKEGHDFTKALDDHEVKAILEYLKTL